MSTPLPDPKRYITDNDSSGHSHFSTRFPDSVAVGADLGGALQRLCYTFGKHPTSLNHQADLDSYDDAIAAPYTLVRKDGGTNVWCIDTPPGGESPMHRTVSLDIVIVVAGEVALELSTGEKRNVAAGDMVVQRSTLHRWRNRSETEWCRMIGVMSECRPVMTDKAGMLEEQF